MIAIPPASGSEDAIPVVSKIHASTRHGVLLNTLGASHANITICHDQYGTKYLDVHWALKTLGQP